MDRTSPQLYVSLVTKGKSAAPILLGERVISFVYDDLETKADKVTLRVDNFDLSFFDSKVFRAGNIVEFTWGYSGVFAPPRQVVIKGVKGTSVLAIEAFGKSVMMHRDRKSRMFENLKRSEIVRQIAIEHGFNGDDVQHIQDTEVTMEFEAQVTMTDAQFLRSLANKEGFEFFVDFDGIHFHERYTAQKPVRKFTYYTSNEGDIIGIPKIEESTLARKGGVKTKGRDPKRKADVSGEANANTEANKTENSASIAVDELGNLDFQAAKSGSPSQNVASGETTPTSEPSSASAQRLAAGKYKRSRINAVKIDFQAIGDPLVVAKSVVEIAGIGESFSGNYYLENVKHSLSSSGYTMHIKGKRSGRNGPVVTGRANPGKLNSDKAKDPDKAGGTGKDLAKQPIGVDDLGNLEFGFKKNVRENAGT